MKKLHSHKNPIVMGVGILSFILITILVLFTTCDIGLGQIVNTEKPVIKNGEDGNGPGSFLQGSSNTIELDVENKLGFKIDEVFMEVDYTDANTGEFVSKRKFPAKINPETGKWEVDLDTSEMADGKISAWVTAVDESGNETTSTEITYFVKNKLPQIEMTIPVINTEKFDDDTFLNNLVASDPVYRRFSLMGVATDDFGIWPGFPKIMIWPSQNYVNVDEDELPRYENGVPTDLYGYWYSMEDIPDPEGKATTATRFSWPMLNLKHDPTTSTAESTYPQGGEYRLPKKDGNENREDFLSLGKYRFRIWTKDRFGNDNFYPDRTDTTREPNNPSKKYIEITYASATNMAMAEATCPEYYNMAKPLLISILLEKNDVTIGSLPVKAKILNKNSADAVILWQGSAEPVGAEPTVNYRLNIPKETTTTWKGSLQTDNRVYVKTWVVDDKGGVAGPELTSYFLVDYTPPDLTIDRPTVLTISKRAGTFDDGGAYNIWYPTEPRPKWVTGIVTVGGSPKDTGTSASGLKQIMYHFGRLGDDNSLTDGATKTLYDAAEWHDTLLHTTAPVSSDTIGGTWSGTQYSWTWTYNIFPNNFKDLYPLVIQTADMLGYSSLSPEWASKRTDSTDGKTRVRFYLPFYVKVIDNADNYRIIHYKLCVDPLMDEPQVFITQPEVKTTGVKPIVGGTVRVAGYAEDNNWMHTVLMRVKKSGESSYYLPPDTTLFYTANPSYPTPDDTAGWFKTTKIGDSSNVNWYANINQDRSLDPSGSLQEVTIEVIAIDCDENDLNHETPHIVGPIEKLVVDFSKDVPIISNTLIKKTSTADRPYTENIKASGTFTFSMDVEAVGNINELSVRINNNSTPVTLIKNNSPQSVSNAWNIGGTSGSGKIKRTITVTVNSTQSPMITGLSYVTGFDYGKTGNLTLEVTAVDNTENNLSTTNTFTIGIDNLYPTAEIQTPHIASESAEKYYFVLGTAKDFNASSETVQGLEHVLVYFEKATISRSGGTRTVAGNGTFVRPNGTNAVTTGASSEFITYPVLNHGGSTTGLLAPNENTYNRYPKLEEKTINGVKVWTSTSAMVIDKAEVVGTADSDGDGTKGEIWEGPSAASKEWGARVDFFGWTDGPYIVHYLIVDQAGNAAHYQNDIYVENNKPRIKSINFGTDINGLDSVTDGTGGKLNEYLYSSNVLVNTSDVSSMAGVMSPSFRIRGNRFGVKLTYEKGNNAKTAKVSYVTQGATVSASTMARGNVYEIVSFGTANTDFTKYGAPNNIVGTAFVATGPVAGTGSGTVIPYSYTGTSTTLSNPTPGDTTVIFGNFQNSWDSIKNSTGDIEEPNKNKRYFVVKVYDTTVAVTGTVDSELDQLSDALLVKLDIDNVDSKKPTLNLLPFGQEYFVNANATPPYNNPAYDGARNARDLSDADYIKNIETSIDGDGNIVKEGYVQYQKHNKDSSANSNISGKVKFIGKVEDNQRIGSIWVSISNYSGVGTSAAGSLFQIARPNTSTNLLEAVPPDATHTGHWKFEILDDNYLTLDYGHSLSWEFMWDSSKVTGIAQENIVVTFQARDSSSTPNSSADKNMTVNVVPYISEVVTSLSAAFASTPSVFNRSALGGYPIRETESITIKGFNLGTFTTNNANNNVTIGGGTNYLTYDANDPPTYTRSNSLLKVTVPNTISSGALVVKVNSYESFNNKTTIKNKDVAYNKEPNNTNNNILDNSRYIYVWRTGDLINSSEMAYNSNPFMRVAADGTRLISYGYYNGTQSGRLRVRRNNTDVTVGAARTNRMINTTVAIGGTNTFYAAGSDLSSNTNQGFQFGRSTDSAGGYSLSTADNQQYLVANYRGIKLADMAASGPDRFKIPRIAVQPTNTTTRSNGSADRILMSYFDDSNNKAVRIIYSNIGETDVGNMAAAASDTVDTTSSELVANSSSTFKGGIYTAVGFLSNGLPVIAWYDATNQNLIFSWGGNGTSTPLSATLGTGTGSGDRVTTSNNTTTGPWQTNAAIIDTGKGTHVDMAISGDKIHLAYYSNNGGLYYAYISTTGSGTSLRPNITKSGNTATNITPVRVDTYLSAGTRIMINVRNDIPYISYAHASFPGTKQSVRVAWRVSSSTTDAGSNPNNTFTGNWEVMTVPVDGIPNNEDFICNGVPTSGTWVPPASGLTYSNLNQTIIVGYRTDTVYEGAILKGNILTTP